MFDFLTVGGLQSVLPYYVEASNLHIKTHIMDNERTIDSCGPFLALLGQKPQVRQVGFFWGGGGGRSGQAKSLVITI